MNHGEHEKAAKTECDTEPVAMIHAAWLEKSLTIGAAEAATELRRLHEVEKQRDELLAALEKLTDVFANIGITSGLYDDEQDALKAACDVIASVKGGAA